MFRPIAAMTLFFLGTIFAKPAHAIDWQDGCRPFIAPAEQYYRLPRGLLAAVAAVESGRNGIPYPWALNIAGQAMMPPDYAAASRLLRDRSGNPRRDVAIGCLQIHMQYHLASFTQPEWALHPKYNVWYGASYLRQLADRYGSWTSAIAHYNASDPAAQNAYLCLVSRRLDEIDRATRQTLGLPLCQTPITQREDRENDSRRRLMAARAQAPLIVGSVQP